MTMGTLVPIMVQHTIPGDKIKCNTEMLIRLAPMISPMMHRVNAYIYFSLSPIEYYGTIGKNLLQAVKMERMLVLCLLFNLMLEKKHN